MRARRTRWLLPTTASPHFSAPPPTWASRTSCSLKTLTFVTTISGNRTMFYLGAKSRFWVESAVCLVFRNLPTFDLLDPSLNDTAVMQLAVSSQTSGSMRVQRLLFHPPRWSCLNLPWTPCPPYGRSTATHPHLKAPFLFFPSSS